MAAVEGDESAIRKPMRVMARQTSDRLWTRCQHPRGKGTNGMSDTILAYISSLGLIGAGLGWIIAGPNSPLFITIGIASIVVGTLSVLYQYRNHGE